MTYEQFEVGMLVKLAGVKEPASVVTAVGPYFINLSHPTHGNVRVYPHGVSKWEVVR